MEDERSQFRELRGIWQKVFSQLKVNEESWKIHFPNTSVEQIDEIINSLNNLFDRVRAPKGFAPSFQLARAFSSIALVTTLSALHEIENENYDHLPEFVAGLNQIVSSFHSMLIFSDNDLNIETTVVFNEKLSEGISLLNTAQSELKSKLELITNTISNLERVEDIAKSIEENKTKSDSYLASIGEILNQSTEKSEIIDQTEQDIAALQKELKEAIDISNKLSSSIEEQRKICSDIQTASQKQQELIYNLLPTATSAGLASAFANRSEKLEPTKKIWLRTFIGSIIGLIVVAGFIVFTYENNNVELWKHVLQRIPFTIPFIWLGWFSAVQYGHTIRIQEDYEFKAATSKAFAGYKDYMEHMASVDLDEANTAMTLIAAKTIEILSHEPLRIYVKGADNDATPLRGILNSIQSIIGIKSKIKSE